MLPSAAGPSHAQNRNKIPIPDDRSGEDSVIDSIDASDACANERSSKQAGAGSVRDPASAPRLRSRSVDSGSGCSGELIASYDDTVVSSDESKEVHPRSALQLQSLSGSSGSESRGEPDEDAEAEALAISSSRLDHDPVSDEHLTARSSCLTHWASLGAMRGLAEYAWQGSGRIVNAGCFSLLASADGEALRYATTALSAAGAGYCSYRLLRARLGSESCATTLAAVVGSLLMAGTAGVATYTASTIPGLGIAVTSTLAFMLSGLQRHANGQRQTSAWATAGPPALVVLGSTASMAVAVCVPALRSIDHGKLARRTLALLAEAATVELIKGSTEQFMPGVDRGKLSFERRLRAGLIGLLPYATASVLFSGVLGNLLRAQMNSERFEDYLVPLLVGALSNVVKGAVNTALLRSGAECPPCGAHQEGPVRATEGLKLPQADKLCAKTALRFLLLHGRDVLFLALIDGGIAEIPAAVITFALYAFFAQHRDLMFDLMQGDGWSEPQIVTRPEISPT